MGKGLAKCHQAVIWAEAQSREELDPEDLSQAFLPCSCCPPGNKHKWVPLQIDMKPEVPREKLASRPTRPQEPRHTPSNRGEIKGMHCPAQRA